MKVSIIFEEDLYDEFREKAHTKQRRETAEDTPVKLEMKEKHEYVCGMVFT